MKLGLLVPRYGEEVVGGTEHWLRSLCEHLAADRGWDVEVYTTCALEASTWADWYPEATVEVNGVTVHRHRSVSVRDGEYIAMYPELRARGRDLDPDRAARFVELVGPVCPTAVDQAVASDRDLVAVTPYLYWPTVVGVPRLGRRVIFHGAAHDEPELNLPQMPTVYGSVGGFAFNSFAERTLVERHFRVGHLPSSMIGNAVVEGRGDPAAARAALGLEPDEPFVLCLGKVERAKSSHVLADLWRLYRARRPAAPRLVFLGPVNDDMHLDDRRPASRSGAASGPVVFAGRQPEDVKWGALAACDFLVAPSAWESFSLVVLEAWLYGKAVMVNARCGPTVEHCLRSGGGIWFDAYGDFEAGVDRLLADADLRAALAGSGEAYARRTFAWPAILDRYERLATRILAAAPLG